MRARLAFLILAAALTVGTAAAADPLDDAAIHAAPQYYLITLNASPVAEVAEAVLGEALGLPYQVDPDIEATMTFRVEGAYAPKALAREFGYRLWNADVALVEKPSDGLWLIPRSELSTALAEGAQLIAPVAAATQTAVLKPATPIAAPATRSPDKRSDWRWLAWLCAGWLGGAASVYGLILGRRRSAKSSPARALPILLEPPPEPDDDLNIPRFTKSSAPADATRSELNP